MAVVAVPGASANSYASNSLFVAVCSGDPYKTDYTTVESEQDAALKTATALLDDVYGDTYKGSIYDATYALYWPRTGVYDPRTGLLIDDYSAFPADLARAAALQAYHVSKADRQAESADLITNVKKEKVDVIEVEYASASDQRIALKRPAIHPEVSRIMDKWVTGGIGQYTSILSRG